MAKISELPVSERPREKALRYGVKSLSNVELIALLIGSGTKDKSAIDIAYELLSNSKGLYFLYNTPHQDFEKVKGMKNIKAIKLAASFELGRRYEILKEEQSLELINSEYIYRHVKPLIFGESREVFLVIILNKKKQIIYEETLFKGVDDFVAFSSKDVLSTLFIHKGFYFFLIHNHPTGVLTPSIADLKLTEKCVIEARSLGFSMLDHLIVSENGYYSFFEQKEFKEK